MSKGPTSRHSKPPKPLTIDLDATDVTPPQPGDKTSGKSAEPAKPASAKAGGAKPAETKDKPAADRAAAKAVESGSGGTSAKGSTSVPGAGSRKTGDTGETTGGSSSAAATASATSKTDRTTSGKEGSTASATSGKTGADGKDTVSSRPNPSTKDASSKPSSPAQPAGSKGGGLGMIASGVIGAIIALGGGYGLQTAGLLPAPASQSDTQGQSDVEAVASRVEGLAGNVDELSAEVADLSSGSAEGGSESDEAIAEMRERIEGLESAIAAGETGNPEAAAELSGFTERLDEIESRVSTLASGAGDGAGGAELSSAVTELRASQSGVNDAVSELQSRTQALADTVSGLQQKQADLAADVEQRLSSIESRLDEPSRQVDLARAIAGAGLRTAIDRGGPFMSELEAFASVAPEDPAVPELRDLAARGVPSRSELLEAFPEAASQAIAAANPVDPDAGLVDRLMSSALSVVKVRPVGDVEGDTPEAIVARTETRLLDGNLEAALNEWRNLPEEAQQAASGFGEGLAARVQAEKLISSSLSPASRAIRSTRELGDRK